MSLISALAFLSLSIRHGLSAKDTTRCGPGALGMQEMKDMHKHTDTHTHTHIHLPPLERMVYQKAKATSSLNDYYMYPMLCKMLHFFAHGTSCILTMVIPSTIICCKANHLVACRFVYSSVFLTRLCTNFGWKSPLFLIMTVLLTDSPNQCLLSV